MIEVKHCSWPIVVFSFCFGSIHTRVSEYSRLEKSFVDVHVHVRHQASVIAFECFWSSGQSEKTSKFCHFSFYYEVSILDG